MAVLEAIKGLTPGQVFPLERDCRVGRHPDCDIVLEVGAISRQHARILKLGDGFFVEDLHSRNGTFLNEQSVRGHARLAENDRLRICDLVFVFRQGSGEAAAASPPARAGRYRRDAGRRRRQPPRRRSTIMSKLDVSAGKRGIRLDGQRRGEAQGAVGDRPQSQPGPGA